MVHVPFGIWIFLSETKKISISKKILNQKINQQMNKMGKRGNWDNLKEVWYLKKQLLDPAKSCLSY